jgi:hypothetical protein
VVGQRTPGNPVSADPGEGQWKIAGKAGGQNAGNGADKLWESAETRRERTRPPGDFPWRAVDQE